MLSCLKVIGKENKERTEKKNDFPVEMSVEIVEKRKTNNPKTNRMNEILLLL